MRIHRLAIVALCAVLGACGNKDEAAGGTSLSGTSGTGGATGETVRLQGSGATFPQPLYQRWFKEYNNKFPNVEVSYQGVGSGQGKKDFIAHHVDFGASDAAMEDEEMAKVDVGALLLPVTAGSIVLAFNLPGIDHLKLSRDAYVGIYLGKVTKWDDPIIAKDNPGVKLPSKPITVARRSDGSGTTFVFTGHLSAVSPEWKEKAGQGTTVQWPGQPVGGKGNPGVTAIIQSTEGGIGYVEYAYAVQQHLAMATLQNKSGNFVDSTPDNCKATLSAVELPENLRAYVKDPDGANSYPIVTYTWILAYKKMTDATKREALKKVLRWCLTEGQVMSPELNYIPLPENVVKRVMSAVDSISD
jgi:phosphate transport system substrate-binding protein